jgi:hypothetical protein
LPVRAGAGRGGAMQSGMNMGFLIYVGFIILLSGIFNLTPIKSNDGFFAALIIINFPILMMLY